MITSTMATTTDRKRVMKKIVWIVNPASRPGKVKRSIPAVTDYLKSRGLDVEVALTERAGDPIPIAMDAAERADAILVAGGDGTVSEILNALIGKPVPLGLIPLGTTNVFARELGIPFDPVAAARAFVEGTPRKYDLGRLEDKHFLIMASYGFDGFSVRHTSLRLKKVIGRYSYPVTGLFGMPFFKSRPIEIIPENESRDPVIASFVVFSNAKRYAGEFKAAPGADMRDGLLDVVCWTGTGRYSAVSGVANLLLGRLENHPRVKVVRAPAVRYRTDRPEWFQVDGDPAGSGIGREGRVAVVPRSFELVTPV